MAMADAIAMAGIAPSDVDYINAHGTATPNNDASESAAFVRLFGQSVPPFSSTKGYTGHTLAAAGGIEAVFSVLAIQHGHIYANHNFSEPIAAYNLKPATRFEEGREVRCVLSNSFGFGGNCSSLLFTR
jgi:3-oxoacyl-[acyl-carrier-protein] synthase-1